MSPRVSRRWKLPAHTAKRPRAAPTAGGMAHEENPLMSTKHATGHVRIIERKGGPVAYAKLKLPDGTEPQRKLGKLWTKRTPPPAGYVTRSMAEARLQAILA